MRTIFLSSLIAAACVPERGASAPSEAEATAGRASAGQAEANGEERPADGCGRDLPEVLLTAARETFGEALAGDVVGSAEVYAGRLDHDVSLGRVLRVRVQGPPSPNPMEAPPQTDHLIAFACRDTWQPVARETFEAAGEEDDECRRGIGRIDMLRIDGVDHFVVTHRSCQFEHDPRVSEETMTILALRDDAFVSVFACAFSREEARGPCRAGPSVERRIQIDDAQTPTIAVHARRTFDPGACDGNAQPDGPTEARGVFRWNGTRFATDGANVCD